MYTWLLVKMLASLVVVCALAFFLLKKLLPRISGTRRGADALVHILERYPLEPRKSLYVIQIGDDYHLIGASEQNVSYLCPLSAKDVQSWRDRPMPKTGRSFQDVLQSLKQGNAAGGGKDA